MLSAAYYRSSVAVRLRFVLCYMYLPKALNLHCVEWHYVFFLNLAFSRVICQQCLESHSFVVIVHKHLSYLFLSPWSVSWTFFIQSHSYPAQSSCKRWRVSVFFWLFIICSIYTPEESFTALLLVGDKVVILISGVGPKFLPLFFASLVFTNAPCHEELRVH